MRIKCTIFQVAQWTILATYGTALAFSAAVLPGESEAVVGAILVMFDLIVICMAFFVWFNRYVRVVDYSGRDIKDMTNIWTIPEDEFNSELLKLEEAVPSTSCLMFWRVR